MLLLTLDKPLLADTLALDLEAEDLLTLAVDCWAAWVLCEEVRDAAADAEVLLVWEFVVVVPACSEAVSAAVLTALERRVALLV